MPRLFTYVLAHDNGAAPNPFGGVCTLVICKPQIRRSAKEGDWIVGTGPASSPLGDIRGHMVYAMRVTGKMPMWKYDAYAQEYLPLKVPDWRSANPPAMVGDAIYDFSHDPPVMRKSVHDESDRARDLRGNHALLSEEFYYFGSRPLKLPEHLLPIVKHGQGHRSNANDEYLDAFLAWLEGLDLTPNRLYGKPSGPLFQDWDDVRSLNTSCGT